MSGADGAAPFGLSEGGGAVTEMSGTGVGEASCACAESESGSAATEALPIKSALRPRWRKALRPRGTMGGAAVPAVSLRKAVANVWRVSLVECLFLRIM